MKLSLADLEHIQVLFELNQAMTNQNLVPGGISQIINSGATL
jgi:hypothetical protein